ncbi:hypothetical protein V5799_018316 [Amblyomma americanum]|uniref:Secreted protein n=1 Tax=Amblyomma americanum TaxID=6943 RepID=A0AAQ4EZL7_AMBAM
MPMPCLVALGALAFTATFVLRFHGVFASENNIEDHPQLTECTERGVARCYMAYSMVFHRPQLQWNDTAEFNEQAFGEACRAFNETSHCYEGFTRCPASMRSNFTRREEGYRALRAFVCDTQAFKVTFITAGGAVTAY